MSVTFPSIKRVGSREETIVAVHGALTLLHSPIAKKLVLSSPGRAKHCDARDVRCAAFSPVENKIAVVEGSRLAVRAYDPETNAFLETETHDLPEGFRKNATAILWSRCGLIAIGTADGDVGFFSPFDGSCLHAEENVPCRRTPAVTKIADIASGILVQTDEMSLTVEVQR